MTDPTAETLVRVRAPHFCAGVVCRDRRVRHAAPILAWAVGLASADFVRRCQREGWRVGWYGDSFPLFQWLPPLAPPPRIGNPIDPY